MTSSLLTLALSASLMVGQTGGKTGKTGGKKPPAKTATKLVKTPAMDKIEKDYGATVLVNEPADGMVSVSVTGAKATDYFMKEVAKIKELDDVLVGSASITDKGIAALAKATKVRRLFLLKCSKLTKACIDDITTMPNLRTLQISEVDLDLKKLQALSAMSSLHSLLLTKCGVTDDDLKAFVGNKKLTALNLAGNDEIKGKGLAYLHSMKQLTFIDVVGTHVSSGQVDDLKEAIKKLGGSLEVRGKPGVGGVVKVKP